MTATAPFDRITFEPGKKGGRACIRGMRTTVSTVVGLVAEGETTAAILAAHPDLEPEDVRHALAHAAWPGREEVMPDGTRDRLALAGGARACGSTTSRS